MAHLTTISWKIGLAAVAAALPFWQLSAMAEDGRADKAETPPPPIEAKAVRVIILPPADEAVFALRPPRSGKAAPAIAEKPAGDAAVVLPPPEPAKIQEEAFVEPPSLLRPSLQLAVQPPPSAEAFAQPRQEPTKNKEDAAFAEPPASPAPAPQIALQPRPSTAASTEPRPEAVKTQRDAAFTAPLASPAPPPQTALQPRPSTAASAEPRPEAVKIQRDAAFAAPPSSPRPSPQIALQPPPRVAEPAQPRPEPAKIKKASAATEIPSLPERPPFRPVLYNIPPAENERNAATNSREQDAKPASFMAKVNSAFKPLTNLWPGKRQASATASPTTEGNGPRTAGAAPGAPAGENPDAKPEQSRFLKSLRFWER